jgi:hypothetical protein
MATETKEKEVTTAPVVRSQKIEKVKHDNIFAALAAFQGENPEVKKTKEFGKKGAMKDGKLQPNFMYAPLDEFLDVVRPLTSKNGIAITWEEGKDGLVCALYHETYKKEIHNLLKTKQIIDGVEQETYEVTYLETGVIRSMPIKVKREGDMKGVGGDSTYARRYTLGEVLGIAADEDTDVEILEARAGTLEGSVMRNSMAKITATNTDDKLKENIAFFDKELKLLAEGKTTSLGLKKEQLDELVRAAGARRKEIQELAKGNVPPATNPSDTTGQTVDENNNAALPAD